jgi:hypothetical protein
VRERYHWGDPDVDGRLIIIIFNIVLHNINIIIILHVNGSSGSWRWLWGLDGVGSG